MAEVEQPPAPRRTYGRARPSVAAEDDGPSLLISRSAAPTAPAPKASPAKELLNGFMDRNATWRGGLGGLLGEVPSINAENEEEEEEVNEEDLKKIMDKMSRAARAGESASAVANPSPPPIATKPAALAPSRELFQFSSTTLTEAPSSQNTAPAVRSSSSPSVVPLRQSSPIALVEEETVPIRKAGVSRPSATGTSRRIVESSDEDNDVPPRRTTKPRSVSASRSPSPGSKEIEDIHVSPDVRFTPSPSPKGKSKAKGPAAYLDRTAGESDAEDEEVQPRRTRSPLSGEEGSGAEKPDAKARKGKPKPLNKKDKLEMHKDMARAGRQRSYAPAKATAVHLPMSSYLPDASAIINARHEEVTHTTPPLHFAASRQVKLESSIVEFTSSEGPSKPTENAVPTTLASSPTPAGSRLPKSRKSREASEDEEIPDLGEITAKPVKPKRDLAAIKAEAIAAALAQKAKAKPRMRGSDAEDDFTVLPKGAIVPSRKPAPPRNPIALRMMPPKQEEGVSSPHRKLQIAGRPKKPKDFTETHVDFAGKAFDHAGLKGLNNGTRKAGQKAGRDVVVPQSAIDQRMRLAHAAQVKAIAAKKQADWGRTKALPERRAVDVDKILASASAIREHEVKEEEGIWDEDDDDGDFRPEGEDEDMEDADEDEEAGTDDERIQFSGEEDGGEDEEDEVSVAETEKDTVDADDDKENQAVPAVTVQDDEEEEDGPAVHLPRATKGKRRTNRIAGSDSEDDETPRRSTANRAPLAEMPVPQPAAAPAAPMLGFDLAGFGDEGEGSFSQLFEATQINTGTTQADAFAGLRAPPPGFLLPSQALLPGVQISDTQRERDNALVGGDIDDEDNGIRVPEKKQQYLNRDGFFTQTRPALPEPTQIGNDTQWPRNDLTSAWSFDQIPGMDDESISPPSAVKRANAAAGPSPTQESPAFSRLKRRTSSNSLLEPLDEMDEDEEEAVADNEDDDEAGDSTSSPAQPRNAFRTMMNASKRAEEREKRRKERSKWVEGEAEESDEDNAWGDVGGADDDEGEDGEEGDQYDPDLVDDTKISEEEKKLQDELAEQKMREIEKADDEKREAQARDIVDGKHRSKRRGMDFFSDGEEEDGMPRRLSKKQRRKRDLGREDGLDKLEGEENVFRKAYEEDLESDEDDTLEDPLPISPKAAPAVAERVKSPEPRRTMKEKIAMLQKRALMNREVDAAEEQRRLDAQVGFTDGFFAEPESMDLDLDDDEAIADAEVDESQFSISRSARAAPVAQTSTASLRSAESWQAYVAIESQTTRRVGALAGGSVVVMNKSLPPLNPHGRRGAPPSRSNSSLSSGSAGVLRSKTSGFV